MTVERETVIKVVLDDGTELKTGDECVFLINSNMTCIGRFKEVTKRGSLKFLGCVNDTLYEFKVMPTSIADVEVLEDK